MVLKYTIEMIREIAIQRGGRCLSDEYKNPNVPMKWECKEGHQWDATWGNVNYNKSWCPTCAGRLYYTIEDVRKIAQERGGKCISDKYINNQLPMIWECEKGHRWSTTFGNVLNQHTWCPKCAGKQKHTIEEMREIARSYGGKCISEVYVNHKTHLLWECREGHRWESTPSDIYNGGIWCQKCANKMPITIGMMMEAAEKKGGKCISEKYTNVFTPLLWECSKGHRWETTPHSIIYSHTWCPKCAHRGPVTIAEMKELALSRGGVCLSEECMNNSNKLIWECAKKHTWEAAPNTIKSGHWCSVCAREKAAEHYRLDINHVREIIESHGGQWVSGEYLNGKSKLQIKCNMGHIWGGTISNIKRNHWCPICARKKGRTLNESGICSLTNS